MEDFVKNCWLAGAGFLAGLALQWLYQRIFGDLFRDMERLALDVRAHSEAQEKNSWQQYVSRYFRRKSINAYCERMGNITVEMQKKIGLKVVKEDEPKDAA